MHAHDWLKTMHQSLGEKPKQMRDRIETMLKPNKSAANIENYDKGEQVNTNRHRPLLPQ